MGDHSRVQPVRQNHPAHHSQYGGSRRPLPAPGHCRPWPHHRAGHAQRTEAVDSRRISVALAIREANARPAATPAVSHRSARGALVRHHWRRYLRRPRGLAHPGNCCPRSRGRRRAFRRPHFRAQPGESVSAPHRKEPARLNWKCFSAMLLRDAHVARRNALQLFLQTFLQPLLFVFIFGRVMVGSGYMPPQYKSLLLPGIIAISMVFTGIWAVAMPLIAEFQWTREIEDRLLAPIDIRWIAIEKVLAGMIQAAVAGLVVIPLAWLVLGRGVGISVQSPVEVIAIVLLVSAFSACGGLALGCSMNQQHIWLMFSMLLTPMIFFGCTYYPWSALEKFPILQKAVLINPIVYASEGMRGTLVPQAQHLSTATSLAALLFFDVVLLVIGLRQFDKKAIS